MGRIVPVFSILLVSAVLLVAFNNCSPGFTSLADSKGLSLGSTGGDAPPAQPAPPADDGKVGVYYAIGHLGRSLRSCDDGRTWIDDRSDDDVARCYLPTTDPKFIDCDHTANRGIGIDGGDGWIFTQLGWGKSGVIQRSRDGVTWEVVRKNNYGSSLMYLEHILFTMFYGPFMSTDQGQTYTAMTTLPAGFAVPSMGKIGKTIVLRGRATGTTTLAFSHDLGATWVIPSIPMDWWNAGFSSGNGTMIAMGTTYGSAENIGHLSYSKDGGATWTYSEAFRGKNLVWNKSLKFDGQNFVGLARGLYWKSADGITWTTEPAYLDGKAFPATGAISAVRNERTGTYAGFSGTFGQFYQNQKAYRSEDGVNWVTLGSTSFKGGHPINSINNIIMDASVCPASL